MPAGFIPQAPAGLCPGASPNILPFATGLLPTYHKRRIAGPRAARAAGRTPRNPVPGPAGDGMGASGKITRAREESRRKLADTQKDDAEA